MRTSPGNADKKLREYLGVWGCQTRMLDPDALVEVAGMTFDVPGQSLERVARAIDALGRVERSARVREAIRKHWPEPTILWPVHAPVRKLLAKSQ